jgi:hypothetical protein
VSLIKKYAFRDGCCSLTWGAVGERQTLRVTGPCIYCGTEQSIRLDAEAAIKFREGGFAQDCFPTLSADQREFLISGICGKCWNEMFPDEEDSDAE